MRVNSKTRFIVFTGMFSLLGLILYFFEFPIFGNYLKIDLSDLPAVLAGVMLGPAAGITVEFIKNLFHVIIKGLGETMGYGDLMNFIVGSALSVSFAAVTRLLLRRRRPLAASVLFGGLAGLVSMVAMGVVGNYLIAPLYFQWALHWTLTGPQLWAAIGSATLLNIIKPLLVTALVTPIVIAGKKYFADVVKQ